MNKICVYTCITGNYDNLREIKNIEKGIDYYCFTNNKKIKSNTWNVVYIEDNSLSNVLLARKTKILGNEIVNKYDIQIWMDAAVEFNKNIKDFIDKYKSKDDNFVCFKHGFRNSIKEEMDACLRFRKENIENINKLKDYYLKEKYNYDNGLIESTVFIRNMHDKKVQETMNLWFEMVKNYTKRDQLSFNYCLFKTGLNVKWIHEYVFNNEWFKWYEHNSNSYPSKYMVYYGDINNNYDYNLQEEYDYINEKNLFIIDNKIINNTKEIYIELSDCSIIKYNIKKIKNNYNELFEFNNIEIGNERIFYQKPGAIILKGDFKKNNMLHIEVEFNTIDDSELLYLFMDTSKKINALKKENEDIANAFNNVLNSTSWKITEPLRKITNIKKKK